MEKSSSSQYHVRSISLPSRLHPKSIEIEAELNKLKSWESCVVFAVIPLTAETIRVGLVGLAGLYNQVEELVHSPFTQQALIQHQCGSVVEEALNGSVGLLDSCNLARDLLSTMKEHVQDLQSVLRRKGKDSSIETNIASYVSGQRRLKKEAAKGLKGLKQMENKINTSCDLELNHYLSMVIRILREVASLTICVLRSLLSFISESEYKPKPSGWSLISKLMLAKETAPAKSFNEVGGANEVVRSLHRRIRSDDGKIDREFARKRLQVLDESTEGLEDGLQILYRLLVKNRVSLLNILVQ